jgi:hypothetical protein
LLYYLSFLTWFTLPFSPRRHRLLQMEYVDKQIELEASERAAREQLHQVRKQVHMFMFDFTFPVLILI